MTKFCRKFWELLLLVDIWVEVDVVCACEREVDKTLLVAEEDEDIEEEDVTDDEVRALVKEEVGEEDVVRALVEDVCLIETYTPVIKTKMMIAAAMDTANVLVIAGFPLFNRLEWVEWNKFKRFEWANQTMISLSQSFDLVEIEITTISV